MPNKISKNYEFELYHNEIFNDDGKYDVNNWDVFIFDDNSIEHWGGGITLRQVDSILSKYNFSIPDDLADKFWFLL